MLTLQDLDNMPSDVYRKKLEDSAFCAEVDALLKSPVVAAQPQPEGEPVDPSMPDRASQPPIRRTAEHVSVAPVAPVAVAPVAPVEQPELTYEYQPMDEFNRPLGGKQVLKYRTPDELTKKLVEQNTSILRQLRKVSREARLNQPTAGLPTEAERFTGAVEFKEKPLTADERFQLTQDLNDPEKFATARDRLLESAVGVPPSQLRDTLNKQQMDILQLRAKENFLMFSKDTNFLTGDNATDKENATTLTDWMFKNQLAPTVDNFNLASSKLRAEGFLLEAPVVQQVVVPTPAVVPVQPVVPQAQEPVVQPVRINEPAPVQPKRQSQVPSGLNDRTSSASGVSPTSSSTISLTLADIDSMSADQYKKNMRNPDFKSLVNRLQKEADDKRRQRANA
jgi:uncharacterized protein (DUF1697 family)